MLCSVWSGCASPKKPAVCVKFVGGDSFRVTYEKPLDSLGSLLYHVSKDTKEFLQLTVDVETLRNCELAKDFRELLQLTNPELVDLVVCE